MMDGRAETTQQLVATQAEGDPAALDRLVPFAYAKMNPRGQFSRNRRRETCRRSGISRVGSIFHKARSPVDPRTIT